MSSADAAPQAADAAPPAPPAARADGERVVKCVVWDLDDTLWEGVLLEDREVRLREGAAAVVRELDARGILQSVASKNDHDPAFERLRAFGLDEYFLYPQINWNPKSSSVRAIAESLNIGLDAVAFIDDQRYEREEVAFSLPEVLCIDTAELDRLLDRPELNPRFITEDSKRRRLMYFGDLERRKSEEAFVGPKEEFLATLGMRVEISEAREEDLRRAEELTVRTNQLNSTGRTYSYEELDAFRVSPAHKLLVMSCDDRFGGYGKVGLALVECGAEVWTLKLLLMSCRVMSKGVGTVMLSHVMRSARRAGARLRADFVANDRNRMMFVTYKFAGFKEAEKDGQSYVLESDLTRIPPVPDYLELQAEDGA
ncbi:MAG TPA: HAD-IIIC family phosphatase [Pyrinomonadaceae bacterium]|nr:HAD-IIIC family phosphatase [Pyrinomonadaceae bacterium]